MLSHLLKGELGVAQINSAKGDGVMSNSFMKASLTCSLLFSLLAANQSSAASTGDQVRAELTRMHNWLSTSSASQGWRTYLRSDDLEEQLKKGKDADPNVIAEILGKYESNTPGLNKARFTVVRTALASWLSDLQYGQVEKLPETVVTAKDRFKPIETDKVTKTKAKLRANVRSLSNLLARSGRDRENGWRKYLQLDELQKELDSEDGPDLAVLQEIATKYRGDHPGLDMSRFVAVRESLLDYVTIEYFSSLPNLKEQFEKQLADLSKHLRAYSEERSGENASAIGLALGWLKTSEQTPELVSGVRKHYSYPNLYGYMSGNLLAAGINNRVYDTRRVSENIMGTDIRGTASTSGTVGVRLVPSRTAAVFDILLYGATRSRTVGSQGPVTIHSTGLTSFNAFKRIYFDENGVRAAAAQANAATNTSINNIDAPPIIRRIAWRIAGSKKGEAEQIASQKAGGQIRQRVDSQANGLLGQMNARFEDEVVKPLTRRRAYPELLQFSTTAHTLNVKVMHANDYQIAAPTGPPKISKSYDVALRMHESAIGNFAESAIGGETLTGEMVADMMKKSGREVPEELQNNQESEPWSITFASSRPVAVEFNDGTITIGVRGVRFTRGSEVVKSAMEMSATYKVEKTATGSKLTRQGDVEARYLKGGRESIQQITLKTFMRRKFGAILKEEIVSEGIEMPRRWKHVGRLQVEHIECDNGWLALGWLRSDGRVRTASRKVNSN